MWEKSEKMEGSFFLFVPASPTLHNAEVFWSLECKGYEKILWPVHLRDDWSCCHDNHRIRASPISESMRWVSMPGMAIESSLPNLNGSSSKGFSLKEEPKDQWQPLSEAHKCLIT